MFVHLTVHDLAGCTVFAWDGKRQRPQYCLCSAASGRLYSVRLTWPEDTVLQVRRAWQGTVFSIAVDLSVLSYLLRLHPGPTPSRRPDRSFSVGPDRVGREREASKGLAYPRSKERGRSRTTVSPRLGLLVGASTRSPSRRSQSVTGSWSWPVIAYLGWSKHVLSLCCLLGQVLQGSGSIRDPRFMNPTGAFEPLWGFCEAVKGLLSCHF